MRLSELETRLEGQRGSTFGSFVAVTVPGMRAKSRDGDPNPFRTGKGANEVIHVRKIAQTAIQINFSYENAVRKQITAGGGNPDGWEKGSTWYRIETREDGTLMPFAIGTSERTAGVRYLHARDLRSLGTPVYIDVRDGSRLTQEQVEPFLAGGGNYEKQRRHGVASVVKVKVWNLDGIRAMNIGGDQIQVSNTIDADDAAIIDAIATHLPDLRVGHRTAALRAADAAREAAAAIAAAVDAAVAEVG